MRVITRPDQILTMSIREAISIDLSERYGDLAIRHPWETSRCEFFLRLLHQMGVDRIPGHWLDVGAGDAWIAQHALERLPSTSEITCWDINYSGDELTSSLAQRPGLHLVATEPAGRFDGILMLDVIEHLEDDLSFLKNIVESQMTEDGWILVSVPAYQFLFTSHDVSLKHYRRYSPSQCVAVLQAAGLTVESQGSLFQALLVVRMLQAAKEKVHPPEAGSTGVGVWTGGPFITRSIERALETESRLSLAIATRSTVTLPGLSFWAFCRRRSEAERR
jgi:hypothetical protein